LQARALALLDSAVTLIIWVKPIDDARQD